MHTLPDVVKARAHACLGSIDSISSSSGHHSILKGQSPHSWFNKFQLYILAKLHNKLFKIQVNFCSEMYKKYHYMITTVQVFWNSV